MFLPYGCDLKEVVVLDDLKMSELLFTVPCASTAKKERGGVLPLPKIVMVKRKTESYELLPDHRLL